MRLRNLALLLVFAGCGAPPPAVYPGPAEAAGAAGTGAPLVPKYAAEPPPGLEFRHPEREEKLAALLPRLAERVDAFFAREKPPSIAVAFIADGQVALTRVLGVADVAARTPANARTLYRIGSVTKTFTASLVIALRDAGLVDLERPAEQYLPELARIEYPFPDAPRLTLRHLLSHTSGLPRLGNFDYTSPNAQVTEAVVLDAAAQAHLDAAPGTRYTYSNFGMSLVGVLAGRRAPEGSLRAALAQRVTGPLGLASTAFDPALVPGAAPATGYPNAQSMAAAPLWPLGASEGAGGLWSNLEDMARWVVLQLSAWPPRPGDDTGPLRRVSLRESHVPGFLIGMKAGLSNAQVEATASGIGLSWHSRQTCAYERIVEHGGAIDGFKADVAFVPERGFGLVILSNALDTNTGSLQEEILAAAAPLLSPREQAPAPKTAALLSELAASVSECPANSYTDLFTSGFRGAVRPEIHAKVCADLRQRHGRCATVDALEVSTPYRGQFVLRCERGEILASADTIEEDGRMRFTGLLVRSTGLAITEPVARAASEALALYERWDDARFNRSFASPELRDALHDGFAKARDSFGSCRFAPGALGGKHGDGENSASIPVDCERGPVSNLDLRVNAAGKVESIFLRPRPGAEEAPRCTHAKNGP
jgi:CubicO group peptidase (beta-lactamase class C family)